jgi:preprotein translocase subunit SecE
VRHQLTTRFTIVVTVVLVLATLLWALLAGADV